MANDWTTGTSGIHGSGSHPADALHVPHDDTLTRYLNPLMTVGHGCAQASGPTSTDEEGHVIVLSSLSEQHASLTVDSMGRVRMPSTHWNHDRLVTTVVIGDPRASG